MRYDRIAAMNRAKDRKPASGGATQKPRARHLVSPSRDSWDWLYGSARAKWDCFAGSAQEDYLRAAFPERYLGFDQ